jgi:hypothetical protein
LVHHFRQNPARPFFLAPAKGPQRAPKSDPVRERIVQARKQNLSIYDIGRLLQEDGHRLSAAYIGIILKEEGFARLPRRADDEPPEHPRPDRAPVADVQQLDLSARPFRTQFGGLFLFLPYLAQIPWEAIFEQNGFPGPAMIPASHAIRALLGLKLYGSARHSHVMSEVFDPGLALFAGRAAEREEAGAPLGAVRPLRRRAWRAPVLLRFGLGGWGLTRLRRGCDYYDSAIQSGGAPPHSKTLARSRLRPGFCLPSRHPNTPANRASPLQLVRLAARAGSNRDHVEGINDVQQPLLVLDDDVVAPHENELGVGHKELLAVRSANDKRAAPGELLPNQLPIHAEPIARPRSDVKSHDATERQPRSTR